MSVGCYTEETVMNYKPGQTVYVIIPEGPYPYRFKGYDKHLPDEWCNLQRIDHKRKYKLYSRKLKDIYPSMTDAKREIILRKLS